MPLGIPHSVFLSWDETDQDKAIEWSLDKASRCSGCGTRKEDWKRDPLAFIGQVEVCPGCAALEQEHENISSAEQEGAKLKGARVFLIPRQMVTPGTPDVFT